MFHIHPDDFHRRRERCRGTAGKRKAAHAMEALHAAAAGRFLPAGEKWEITLGRIFRDS